MWKITERIDIAAAPETVFDYLSRFETVQEWDPGVLTARRRTPGPPAVGSRVDVTLRFGWRRVPMTYEVKAMQRPGELVLEGRGAGFTAGDRIVLERIPNGTRLTYQVVVRFSKPPSRIADAGLRLVFQISARRAIRRLRAMLAGAAKPPRLTLMTRLADRSILVGMLGFTRAGFHLAKARLPAASGLYSGRTMVLTGGTAGIGRAAAADLYNRCAHLVVVGRSAQKLQALQKELMAMNGGGRIETETADMSLTADVRDLAVRLMRRHPKIDVLIHNAGALFNDYGKTAEGIERTLATDLLGPYLLTGLLRPALEAAGGARVILVASGGMYTQKIRVDDLQSAAGPYNGPVAYARAKRGLVILAGVWARQLARVGIGVHAMHPGWVDTPGLRRSLPGFQRFLAPVLRTPDQGADTIVWLAASADAGRTSGGFWLDRKLRATHVFPGTRETAGERRRLIAALDGLTRQAGD